MNRLNSDLIKWVGLARKRAQRRRHDLTRQQNQFVAAINLQHAKEIEGILRANKMKLSGGNTSGKNFHSGSETSKDGAVHVAIRAGSQRHRLLKTYKDKDRTAWEAAVAAHLTEATYWMRISELHSAGYLASTETRRKSARTGCWQEVLSITDQGLEYLRNHE